MNVPPEFILRLSCLSECPTASVSPPFATRMWYNFNPLRRTLNLLNIVRNSDKVFETLMFCETAFLRSAKPTSCRIELMMKENFSMSFFVNRL